MSKIALTPNASGTGIFTISSPATNTDRTLTLPDITGTLVSTDASGNVGIGTSSPDVNLDVTKTSDGIAARFQRSSGGGIVDIETYNGIGGIGTSDNIPFRLNTNNTERMRIDSSGNVLVGTTDTSPASNDVAGSLRSSTGLVQASVSGNPCLFVNRKTNDGGVVSIRRAGSQVGSISVTASATAYNTSSDYRLKTDAQPMSGASDRVLALKPVNFEWISTGTRVDGFLAHEAQEIVPEAVHGTKDAMRDEEYEVTAAVYEDIIIAAVLDEEGNELEAERTEQRLVTEAVMGTRSVPDMQGIDQSKLVPLLTAALQEALTEISALKARVTALES